MTRKKYKLLLFFVYRRQTPRRAIFRDLWHKIVSLDATVIVGIYT